VYNFRVVTIFNIGKTDSWNIDIEFLKTMFFINLPSLVLSVSAIY